MATALVPVPIFKLAEPSIVIPELPFSLGVIRTLAQYDVMDDSVIIRMDAFNGKDQYGVDMRLACRSNLELMREEYLRSLEPANLVLRNALIDAKWKESDFVALPMPRGYVAPPWMHA